MLTGPALTFDNCFRLAPFSNYYKRVFHRDPMRWRVVAQRLCNFGFAGAYFGYLRTLYEHWRNGDGSLAKVTHLFNTTADKHPFFCMFTPLSVASCNQ